jgi:hypothetical protein
MNCERANATRADMDIDWGCWRWFDPTEYNEDAPDEYVAEEPTPSASHSPENPGVAEEPEGIPPTTDPDVLADTLEESDVPFFLYIGDSECSSVPAELFDTVRCFATEVATVDFTEFQAVEAGLQTNREEPLGEAELLEPIAERILEDSGADVVVLEARYLGPPNSYHEVEVFASDQAQHAYEEYGVLEPQGPVAF